MSFIPCVEWVRRGVAKERPEKLQVTQEEMKAIIKEMKKELDEEKDEQGEEGEEDEEEQIEQALDSEEAGGSSVDAKYNLKDYTAEDSAVTIKGVGSVAQFASNEEDPLITEKETGEDSDSDIEDFLIKPTDNLIVAARVEDEFCLLEVHVYNEEEASFYAHHEIMLPSFPLAIEWMDFDPTLEASCNYVAVSYMTPNIDVWDVDLVDTLEPEYSLGAVEEKRKKKKKAALQLNDDGSSHSDAVLDLSWNRTYRHILASASADTTVGLWDLHAGKISTSIRTHSDKVQCLHWHPTEPHSLVSGSFDRSILVHDCRNADELHKSWTVDGEVEKVLWNHFNPYNFLAATDSGTVYSMDIRQEKPLFVLSAHTKTVTGIALSSEVPGLMCTVSVDQIAKIWDIENDKPSFVSEKNFSMGTLYCVKSSPNSPFVFAYGGHSGELKVLDVRENEEVVKRFESRKRIVIDIQTAETDTMVDADESMEVETSDTVEKKEKKKKKKKKKKEKKQEEDEELSS